MKDKRLVQLVLDVIADAKAQNRAEIAALIEQDGEEDEPPVQDLAEPRVLDEEPLHAGAAEEERHRNEQPAMDTSMPVAPVGLPSTAFATANARRSMGPEVGTP